MPTPCEQSDNIIHINDTLKRMEKSANEERSERRESEKKLMAILERVADQGARINNVESHLEVHFENIKEMFNRLHDVEMTVASNGPNVRMQLGTAIEKLETSLTSVNMRLLKVNNFINLVTHKYAVGVYIAFGSMTVAGALCDFTFHYETLKKFLSL